MFLFYVGVFFVGFFFLFFFYDTYLFDFGVLSELLTCCCLIVLVGLFLVFECFFCCCFLVNESSFCGWRCLVFFLWRSERWFW